MIFNELTTTQIVRVLGWVKWFAGGFCIGVLLKFLILDANAQEPGAATLNWKAPIQNTDGTPLVDLAGYKLLYGNTAGGPYDREINVPNPDTTTYVVENLAPGDYYFVSTAYNAAGKESDFSNEALKVIAGLPSLFTVVDGQVFNLVKQKDKFVLLPVGAVPMGTECDPTQSVNGHHVVPNDAVQWLGNVEPIVVVAKCF